MLHGTYGSRADFNKWKTRKKCLPWQKQFDSGTIDPLSRKERERIMRRVVGKVMQYTSLVNSYISTYF